MASRPTSQASRHTNRDTGFPESFSKGSSTTLPHPEADLSPNACISHDDLACDRALKRKRLTFLHQRNKRSINHGFLSPQSELANSITSLQMVDTGRPISQDQSAQDLARTSTASFRSKDGSESVTSMRKFEDTPPSSPDSVGPTSPKKTGFFKKWRR